MCIRDSLIILLSDIEGLYTDNPKTNPKAQLIRHVSHIDQTLLAMGTNESSSNVGTGGMSAKLVAAQIAMDASADLVIAKFEEGIVTRILQGQEAGTYFCAKKENL